MNDETGRLEPVFPIDLVDEADFVLGAARVSPSRREVSHSGLHEALEPRIMQVLVALHQANGRVVSRDELIARCWEGRIVGEDAITRAIGRLRRLSEIDGGASFHIETIPKIGFRLVSGRGSRSSGEPPPAKLPPRPAAAVLPPRRQSRLRWAAAGVAAVLAAAMVAWLLWPAPRWTVESSRSFISTMALEGEPAFSPDGKMLAYTSGANLHSRQIFVRNLAGGDAIRITNDANDDVSPTWSPDGTRIAYVAQSPGELCRIMVASVPAGEARQVARCTREKSTLVSWQPGTSFLYYFDRVGAIEDLIFRLDLDSGALLQLPKTSLDHIVSIERLQCSPDGKSLLYVRNRSASTYVIVIRDLASGNEKILGTLVGSWLAAWSEDSRTVLVSTAHGIGSEITAYPVDGGTPYRVYTTTINVSHLAAGAGGLLALETDTSRQNLARLRPEPSTQPDIIDPVNGKTWAPSFAPDGTLAFLSNRSGNNAVWIMKPGAAPAILFDASLAPLFRLQFSPDGSRLALVTAGANMNIRILTVDGETVASFDRPSIGFGNPAWTPDGKSVILVDIPTRKVVRIAIDDPARPVPYAQAPRWVTFGFHDNRIFGPRLDSGGIWEFGKVPRLINSKYPRDFAPPVTFQGDDVLIPDFNAAGGARILSQPLAGGADRVLGYAPGAEAQDRFFESKMAVNPKTGEVIYVAAVQGDTNIDLLTLARH